MQNEKSSASKSGAKRLARIALFTALMAVCAQISIPLPQVNFTLQTFAVMLAAAILRRDGVFAVAAYLFLGLVGAPVFNNFGSTANLFGLTGGYLVGFLPMAAVIAAISKFIDTQKSVKETTLTEENIEEDEKKEKAKKRGERRKIFIITCIAAFIGDVVCFAFGTAWFIQLYPSVKGTSISLWSACTACVFPFILPDLLKILLASYLTSIVCTRFKNLLQ